MRYRGATVSAFTGMTFFGMGLMTPGMIIPELGGYAGGRLPAIIAVVFPACLIAGAVLSAWMTDSKGFRKTLSAGSILVSAGCFLLGAESAAAITAGAALLGIGCSILNCTTSTLISDLSSPAKRTANVSMVAMMFSVGATGLTGAMSIFAEGSGYGAVLACVGVLAAGQTLLQLFSPYPEKILEETGNGGMWRNGIFFLLACILFFNSGLEGAVNNWMAGYLSTEGGITVSDARSVMVYVTAGYAVIRIAIAAAERKVGKAVIVFPSVAAGIAGLALMCFCDDLGLVKSGAVLSGIGTGAVFPVIIGITGDIFRERSGAAISSIIAASLVGNTAFNLVTGYGGIGILPSVGFAAVSVVMVLFIPLFLKLR